MWRHLRIHTPQQRTPHRCPERNFAATWKLTCFATYVINQTNLPSTRYKCFVLTCLVNEFVLNLSINRIHFILIFVYGSHLTNNFAVTGIHSLKSRKVNKQTAKNSLVKLSCLDTTRGRQERRIKTRCDAYLFYSKKELLLSKRRSVVVNIFKLDNNCCISKRKKSFATIHVTFLDLEIAEAHAVS